MPTEFPESRWMGRQGGSKQEAQSRRAHRRLPAASIRPLLLADADGVQMLSRSLCPTRPEEPTWPATAPGAPASATSTRLSPSDFRARAKVMTSTGPIRTKAAADVLSSGGDGLSFKPYTRKRVACVLTAVISCPLPKPAWGNWFYMYHQGSPG